MLTRTLHQIKRFRRNQTGVAAVEFAYIAPILIVALFGTIEASRGVMMHKRFQRVSAMIGDLISRESAVGTTSGTAVTTLNGMMLSAKQVMLPFSTTALKLNVNSLRAKSTDATQTKSEWNYRYDGATPNSASTATTCAVKPMPTAGMLTAGNTAIVVEAQYTFTPLMTKILRSKVSELITGFSGEMTWTDTITYSPRKSSCVAFEDKNCGTLCPGW